MTCSTSDCLETAYGSMECIYVCMYFSFGENRTKIMSTLPNVPHASVRILEHNSLNICGSDKYDYKSC